MLRNGSLAGAWVRSASDCELPLVIEAGAATSDLAVWADEQRTELRSLLSIHGAILFTGFRVDTPTAFGEAFSVMAGKPLDYVEQSSARRELQDGIYTSTEYPQQREIFLHSEQSYNLTFPGLIAFCCLETATAGGQTPLADARRVLRRIAPHIKDRFLGDGYLYVRNFGGPLRMPWRQAFRVEHASQLAQYCAANDISIEWPDKPGEQLVRTRQRRSVIARHPISGELVWFNHLTFFHRSTLDADLRELLLQVCGADALPHGTYHADGSEIDDDLVAELRAAYVHEERVFEWRAGDVLLLDNLLVAHGRKSFEGSRRVIVAMAQPTAWNQVVVAKELNP